MVKEKPQISLRIFALFAVAGLFVFLLYLYLFVPFGQVVTAVERANLLVLGLAFGVVFAGVVFNSLAWARLLGLLSVRVSFLKVFLFVWVASFVDILIPAESMSGDVSKVYLMSRESGESDGKIVASVVSQRILGMVVTIVTLVLSAVYFVVVYHASLFVEGVMVFAAVGSVVLLGLLLYVSATRSATERLGDWVVRVLVWVSRGRWRFERLKAFLVRLLDSFHEGILTLSRRPRGLVLPLLFTVLAWLSDVFVAVLVFVSLGSFGVNISLSAIVIVYSISIAIEDVPVGVPWEVGTLEVVMTSLFVLLGCSGAIGVFAVAAFLIRVFTVWVKLLVGGWVVQFLGVRGLFSGRS